MVSLPVHHRPTPRHRAHHRHLLAMAFVVLGVVLGVTIWGITGARDDPAAEPAPAPSPATASGPDRASEAEGTDEVQVKATLAARVASPMEAVAVTGTVDGTAPGAAVQVQLRDGGRWVGFPLRPVVDEAGRFSTFVEIGEPGVHKLRVVEPTSGLTSPTMTVRVR